MRMFIDHYEVEAWREACQLKYNLRLASEPAGVTNRSRRGSAVPDAGTLMAFAVNFKLWVAAADLCKLLCMCTEEPALLLDEAL